MLSSSIGQQIQGPRASVPAQAGTELEEQAETQPTGKGTTEDCRGRLDALLIHDCHCTDLLDGRGL